MVANEGCLCILWSKSNNNNATILLLKTHQYVLCVDTSFQVRQNIQSQVQLVNKWFMTCSILIAVVSKHDKLKCYYRQNPSFPARLPVIGWSATALISTSTQQGHAKAVHTHGENVWKPQTNTAKAHKALCITTGRSHKFPENKSALHPPVLYTN